MQDQPPHPAAAGTRDKSAEPEGGPAGKTQGDRQGEVDVVGHLDFDPDQLAALVRQRDLRPGLCGP